MQKLVRSLLALILVATPAGPGFANPPGGGGGVDNAPGGLFDSEQTIDRIPLDFADRVQATVLYLFIVTGLHVYAYQTLNAVVKRNESRLPVARIPILSQLVRPEFQRADFASDKQVGSYYQLGKSLLIDLRSPSQIELATGVNINWDQLEAKLAAEAHRPVPGQIPTEGNANGNAAPVQSVVVFNRDASYTMLLGGVPVSEEVRRELVPFMSNLLLMGHLFRKAAVAQRNSELLVLVQPSIVERSWD
jgi:hypothetical protein